MAELKTKRTGKSVEAFLAEIDDEKMREDCRTILQIMKTVTKADPEMWGPSIVGFGRWHYKYDSGREGDWFVTGFAPRKRSLTLYLMDGLRDHEELLAKLGEHTTGKGCLYIKRIDDVDVAVLERLIARSVERVGGTQA